MDFCNVSSGEIKPSCVTMKSKMVRNSAFLSKLLSLQTFSNFQNHTPGQDKTRTFSFASYGRSVNSKAKQYNVHNEQQQQHQATKRIQKLPKRVDNWKEVQTIHCSQKLKRVKLQLWCIYIEVLLCTSQQSIFFPQIKCASLKVIAEQEHSLWTGRKRRGGSLSPDQYLLTCCSASHADV